MSDDTKPAKVRMVWIVVKGEGLHQVPADKVEAKISNDKGRRATERDLSIAGVIGAPEEEEG